MPPTSRLLLSSPLNLLHHTRPSQFKLRRFGAQDIARQPICKSYLHYSSGSRNPFFLLNSNLPLSSRSRISSSLVRVGSASKQSSTRPNRSLRYFGTEEPLKTPAHPGPLELKAAFGGSSGLSIALLSVALLLYVTIGHQNTKLIPTDDSNSQNERPNIETIEFENWSNMAGEISPGRPGTLTAEQTEKLREFWVAVLQVFGVLHASELDGGAGLDINAVGHQDTLTVEKSKKGRLSFFGRKKNKDSDTESLASGESSPSVPNVDDDKYGQTKQFHDALAQQTPAQLRATLWSMVKHDNPDALLLRFLRARKWDVEKALIMMVSTMNWRAEELHVDDDIVLTGEEGSLKASQGADGPAKQLGQDFLTQMRLGKSFLHGTDKEQRPMCFVRVRLHKQGEQSEESLERYTVFIIESARMVLSPPIDTAVSHIPRFQICI